jgi:hypothetical protein
MNKKALAALDISIKKYEKSIEILKAYKGKEVNLNRYWYAISYYDPNKKSDIILAQFNSDVCPLCHYTWMRCEKCPITKANGTRCNSCCNTPWINIAKYLHGLKKKKFLIMQLLDWFDPNLLF